MRIPQRRPSVCPPLIQRYVHANVLSGNTRSGWMKIIFSNMKSSYVLSSIGCQGKSGAAEHNCMSIYFDQQSVEGCRKFPSFWPPIEAIAAPQVKMSTRHIWPSDPFTLVEDSALLQLTQLIPWKNDKLWGGAFVQSGIYINLFWKALMSFNSFNAFICMSRCICRCWNTGVGYLMLKNSTTVDAVVRLVRWRKLFIS